MSKPEDLRQIIVMRSDLSMPVGKMVAQGAHASMKVLLDQGSFKGGRWTPPDLLSTDSDPRLVIRLSQDLEGWLLGLFTKICVQVGSEAELLEIYERAQSGGLPCALITDSGLTVFKGVPTKTCCAIGPATRAALDPITGHLRLL